MCQALELDTGETRCDEMISGFLVLRENYQWISLNLIVIYLFLFLSFFVLINSHLNEQSTRPMSAI